MAPLSSSPPAASQRRELLRAYKQAGPRMGLYRIRNLAEGRFLLGASLNVDGALSRAMFELKLGTCRPAALQADWQRLGAAQFALELVDTVRRRSEPGIDYREELADLCQLWREEFCRQGLRPYDEGKGAAR